MPRRVWMVGARDHVLDRFQVLVALVAIAPVLVGQLPTLERILLTALESLQLLLVGDVEPELDQDRALVGEGPLETVDLVVGPQPLLPRSQLLDPLDEDASVPGAIEDRHPAPARQDLPEAPEEVVALLVVGRGGELDDADVAGVDLGDQPLDAAALAGGVPALEEDADRRAELALADQAAEGEPQLAQPLPGEVERPLLL